MNTFIGVDLGWYGKPSGLASLALEGSELRLRNITRLESVDEILGWIQSEARGGSHPWSFETNPAFGLQNAS